MTRNSFSDNSKSVYGDRRFIVYLQDIYKITFWIDEKEDEMIYCKIEKIIYLKNSDKNILDNRGMLHDPDILTLFYKVVQYVDEDNK